MNFNFLNLHFGRSIFIVLELELQRKIKILRESQVIWKNLLSFGTSQINTISNNSFNICKFDFFTIKSMHYIHRAKRVENQFINFQTLQFLKATLMNKFLWFEWMFLAIPLLPFNMSWSPIGSIEFPILYM